MKAFKKLMAAALVCVMALTMLTGCSISDKLDEKAMVKELNKVSKVVYTSKNDLDSKADEAWTKNNKDGVVTTAAGVNGEYKFIIVEVPDSASKSGNCTSTVKKIDNELNTCAKNKNDKIEIGVSFKSGKKGNNDCDYVVVVAKAK